MISRNQVLRLVDDVSADHFERTPEVRFVDHHLSHTHDDSITLMSPEFWKKHKVGTKAQYRLLVLHEMTHWLLGWRVGHTPEFYAFLFELCPKYGVRVSTAYDDEVKYKPRAARAGLELLVA